MPRSVLFRLPEGNPPFVLCERHEFAPVRANGKYFATVPTGRAVAFIEAPAREVRHAVLHGEDIALAEGKVNFGPRWESLAEPLWLQGHEDPLPAGTLVLRLTNAT